MSNSQWKKKPPTHLTYKQLDFVLFYCKEDKAIAEEYVDKWNNWGHDGCLYDDQFYLDWRFDQDFNLIADLCHRASYQILLVTKNLLKNKHVAFLKNQILTDSIISNTNSVLPLLFNVERNELPKEKTYFGISSVTPLYIQQIDNKDKFGKLFTYPDVVDRKTEREENQNIKLEEWVEIEKIRIKKIENRKTMLCTRHSNCDADLSEDGSDEIAREGGEKTTPSTGRSNADADLSEDSSYEIERKGGEKTTPSTGRSNADADLLEVGTKEEIEREGGVKTAPQGGSEYDFASNFANHNEEDDGFKLIGAVPNVTPQYVRPKEKHIASVGNLQAAGDSRQGRADLVAQELHQVGNLQAAGDSRQGRADLVANELHEVGNLQAAGDSRQGRADLVTNELHQVGNLQAAGDSRQGRADLVTNELRQIENLQAAGDVAHVVAKELHQGKCNHAELLSQVKEDRQLVEEQQLSLQLDKGKKELSQQVDSQLRVISDQMFLQGKELSRNISMDAGDASQVNLTYSHPVLQNNKALLERHLNVTTELLHRLVTLTVISGDQHKKISTQMGEGGKQKLLLYCVDHRVMEENRLIHCFIEALQDIGGDTNTVLATSLANSCTGDTS